jgi:hypothetical protein
MHAGLNALCCCSPPAVIACPPMVFTQWVQEACVQREAADLLFLFIHPSSPGSKYTRRSPQNSLQATTWWWCSPPGSMPTKNRLSAPGYSCGACKC